MDLRPGMRLRSQVCTTEVIVIKAPTSNGRVDCGGLPLAPLEAAVQSSQQIPADGFRVGSQLGKRYVSTGDSGLEILVTAAGEGSLSDEYGLLKVADPKQLPASD